MRNRCKLAACGLVLAGAAAHANAAVVAVGASKDGTLFEDPLGEVANGSGQYFFVGKSGPFLVNIRRGMLAFDVAAALPVDAVITSVELRLHLSIAGGINSHSLELHRLLTDWGEGESDADGEEGPGTIAEPGDATWLHTFYDDQFWTNPGGDFDATISAAQIVGVEAGFYSWSSAQMAADVQNWVDNPGTNFGWILMGGEDSEMSAKRFDAHEIEDIEFRPVLFVTYVPAPGALALLGLGMLAPRRRRR